MTIHIYGCSDIPCSFARGSPIKMDVSFIPLVKNIYDLDISFSTKLIFRFVMPGMERNGCKYGKNICPLIFNKINTINMTITVPSYAPKVISIYIGSFDD